MSVRMNKKEIQRLKKDIESLEKINERQEERINNLEAMSLQDINRFFLFEGVLLAAIMMSTFDCRHWWIPLVMNLSIGLLNVANLLVNTIYFVNCSEELDKNVMVLNAKRRELNDGVSREHNYNQQHPKPDPVLKWGRRVLRYFNVVVCVASMIFVCVCCFQIKCNKMKK